MATPWMLRQTDPNWLEDHDYKANAIKVGSDGNYYIALQASGPNTEAGVQDPVTATSYWQPLSEFISALPLSNSSNSSEDSLYEGSAGDVSPSVQAVESRYLQASNTVHTSFIFKGGTFIKLTHEDGESHLFGNREDVTFSAPSKLDTGDTLKGGYDYYVYLCSTDFESVDIVVSLNSTYPKGYDAYTSRKIGGFHTLCADVGDIDGHDLTGYEEGDILPCSFWTLRFRPVSNSEGMLYDEGTGKWWGIYLASYDGSEFVSEYGAEIADGNTEATYPMHCFNFMEIGGKQGYRLPWQHEFVVAAKGSNEGTSYYSGVDPNLTGGNVDSNRRRMISNIGLEDCCGIRWQWCNDTSETISRLEYYTTSSSTSQPYWNIFTDLDDEDHKTSAVGYSFKDNIRNTSSIDGDSKYGEQYGAQRNVRMGGPAVDDNEGLCGSRSSSWDDTSVDLNHDNGARFVSDPRIC